MAQSEFTLDKLGDGSWRYKKAASTRTGRSSPTLSSSGKTQKGNLSRKRTQTPPLVRKPLLV